MSDDSPTKHFEHAEHAEHAAHEGTPFLLTVSVTIAILAVVAASVGSLETIETAATFTEQNAASLLQNKTSDQWAFFQAKSIKKNAYDIASRQGGKSSDEFAKEAQRYKKNRATSKKRPRSSNIKSRLGCTKPSGMNTATTFLRARSRCCMSASP